MENDVGIATWIHFPLYISHNHVYIYINRKWEKKRKDLVFIMVFTVKQKQIQGS